MEYLPEFELIKPRTIDDAVAALAAHPDARLLAGGTDFMPNMRRGLIEGGVVVDVSGLTDMSGIAAGEGGLSIGAAVRLDDLANDKAVQADYPAIAQAAGAVAGPTQRRMGTVGGNLCLDTRCFFYNQSEWWRSSNDYCLKYRGDICHVVPTSKRCYATYSGDLAAALVVLGAEVEIADAQGRRRMAVTDLFEDEGETYLKLPKGAMVTALHIPKPPAGQRSAYSKIRVRQSIDFPLAGVAIGLTSGEHGVTNLRLGLIGTNSMPMLLELGEITGTIDDAAKAAIEKAVQKIVSPLRTTLIQPQYRRRAIAAKAASAVRELAA